MSADVMIGGLVTLIAGLGGAAIGALAVWRSQTRGLRLRERSVAAALLQDLDRVEPLVPTLHAGDYALFYREKSYPTIHPWIQPLIVDLAARDAEVVGCLMQLEQQLADHRSDLLSAYSTERSLVEEKENAARVEAGIADADQDSMRDMLLRSRQNIAERIQRLELANNEAVACWRATDAALQENIGQIRHRLHALVGAPIPEFPWPAGDELLAVGPATTTTSVPPR